MILDLRAIFVTICNSSATVKNFCNHNSIVLQPLYNKLEFCVYGREWYSSWVPRTQPRLSDYPLPPRLECRELFSVPALRPRSHCLSVSSPLFSSDPFGPYPGPRAFSSPAPDMHAETELIFPFPHRSFCLRGFLPVLLYAACTIGWRAPLEPQPTGLSTGWPKSASDLKILSKNSLINLLRKF